MPAEWNDAESTQYDASLDGTVDKRQVSDSGGPDEAAASDRQVAMSQDGAVPDMGGSNEGSVCDANSAGSLAPSDASDGGQPRAMAFVSATVGPYYDPNFNRQNTCSLASAKQVLSVGTAAGIGVCSNGPVAIASGDLQADGATIAVRCAVTPANGGYLLDLQATLGATGSVSIFGQVDAMSGGQGVSGDITYQGSEYQANNNCTVTYMYAGAPVPQHPPIAPRRIWAHMSCPQMRDPNGVSHVVLANMSIVPEVCDGEVDFLFENCAGAPSSGASDAATDGMGQDGVRDADAD
jgi:hypothetical protein